MTFLVAKWNVKIERNHLQLQGTQNRATLLRNVGYQAVVGKTVAAVANDQMVEELDLHGTTQHEKVLGQFHILR